MDILHTPTHLYPPSIRISVSGFEYPFLFPFPSSIFSPPFGFLFGVTLCIYIIYILLRGGRVVRLKPIFGQGSLVFFFPLLFFGQWVYFSWWLTGWASLPPSPLSLSCTHIGEQPPRSPAGVGADQYPRELRSRNIPRKKNPQREK